MQIWKDELDFESMRENEGEAANYGVYYDDTSYDYMQHLREVGEGSGEAHFVDSAQVKVQGKGKGRGKIMKLEDALREASLDEHDGASELGPGSVTDDGFSSFSSASRPRIYQDMQDIPDEIAGFQPDMDPRLREVLEALEDDAYVDEQDEEDVFGALTNGDPGAEVDFDEFDAMRGDGDGDGDDGWESDATEKAPYQQPHTDTPTVELKAAPIDSTDISSIEAEAASAEDGDWLRDFAKFKRGNAKQLSGPPAVAQSSVQSPPSTLYTLGGTPLRQKRRKGALTNLSAYSMTSSSLARTDGQRLLDSRFERIEAMYGLDEAGECGDDEDGRMSLASGISKQSKISTASTKSFADGPVRSDLEGVMDGFLDGWDKGHPGGGKRKGAKGKRGKNGNELLGMKMLDEVREGLGPAKVSAQKA